MNAVRKEVKACLEKMRQPGGPELANDPRVKAVEEALREWVDFDVAVELLALFMVKIKNDTEAIRILLDCHKKLAKKEQETLAAGMEIYNIGMNAVELGKKLIGEQARAKSAATARGTAAANALHGRPGSSRDKQEQIRAAWASGKYASRDLCAEQECAALNMAFGTARRALRNTPAPPRRCGA